MATENDRHFLTGTIWKGLQDTFHPNAKQLVQLGRNYEKAQFALTASANSYYDAIEQMGESAINTSTSSDIGNVYIDVANTWRYLHQQHEQLLKLFHKELIVTIEKRLQQSVRSIPLAVKDYNMGYKVKSERCDKARCDWKKYQKKSQKSTNLKYEHKNRQSQRTYTEQQSRLDEHIQLGNRMANLEERALYTYIADKHCAIIRKQLEQHSNIVKLLSTKLDDWSEVISHTHEDQKNDNSLQQQQTSESGTSPSGDGLDADVENALKHMLFLDSKEYSQTLPHPPKRDTRGSLINRRSSGCGPLLRYPSSPNVCKETSVQTVIAKYNHTAGSNGIQLSFDENDAIVILSDKSKDGWQYGQNARTRKSGWFPISYTIDKDDSPGGEQLQRTGSTSDILADSGLPLPDYTDYSDSDYMSTKPASTSVQRPTSIVSQLSESPVIPVTPPYSQRPLPSTSSFIQTPTSSIPPQINSPSPIQYQLPQHDEVVYSQPIVMQNYRPPSVTPLIIPPPPPPPIPENGASSSPGNQIDGNSNMELPRINPFTNIKLRRVTPNDRSAPKF